MAMLFSYKRIGEKIGEPVRIGSCVRAAYAFVRHMGMRGPTPTCAPSIDNMGGAGGSSSSSRFFHLLPRPHLSKGIHVVLIIFEIHCYERLALVYHYCLTYQVDGIVSHWYLCILFLVNIYFLYNLPCVLPDGYNDIASTVFGLLVFVMISTVCVWA